MKYWYLLIPGALAFAQSTTNTYVTDVNGRRVDAASVASTDGVRTERSRSINGREVPLEQIEERVLRQDPNHRTIEKIVRKFDPNGRLASTDRIVTEEQKLNGGDATSHTTIYRSDVNGHVQESERVTTEVRTRGGTRSEETVIERPTINGAFERIEKRAAVAETSGPTTRATEKVYRRAMSGEFYEAVRQVSDVTKTGDKVIEHSAYYEPGTTSQLELRSQTASTTTLRPDGSEVSEVNLYSRAMWGRVQDNEAPQQVKEQQLIERKPGPGGSVIETVSVRRPSIADPRRLGDFKQISETVCRGKCTPPPQDSASKP